MKLTAGVNFISVKRTDFLHERRFGRFFLVTRTYKNDVRTKNCEFYIDEIDTWLACFGHQLTENRMLADMSSISSQAKVFNQSHCALMLSELEKKMR